MNLGRWIISLTGLVEILQLFGIVEGSFDFIAQDVENISRSFFVSPNSALPAKFFNDQGAIGITACRT